MPEIDDVDRVLWIPTPNPGFNNLFQFLCRGRWIKDFWRGEWQPDRRFRAVTAENRWTEVWHDK